MRDDRLGDPAPMRRGAEQVGDVAAMAENAVVDGEQVAGGLVPVESGDARHGALL